MKKNSAFRFTPDSALLSTSLLATLLCFSESALACASCGCTLNADWSSMNLANSEGLKLDLREDFLNQNQLRSGTGTISPQAASQIVNSGNPQEVEKFTLNHYLMLGLDYTFNPDWGINLQLPYITRNHSTLGTASDGNMPGDGGGQYDSQTSGMGDLKLIARYQGLNSQHNLGLMFGVKLPTGSYTANGQSTDPTSPGPLAIDRGLQNGTGTTDVILGAYYLQQINDQWDMFAQGIFQAAINSRDDYRPGNGTNLNLGFRYNGLSGITPMMQFNFRHVAHDTGANADTVSTGGNLLYFSPGFMTGITPKLSAYAHLQLPLYQDVRGVQLAPKYLVSAGLRYSF